MSNYLISLIISLKNSSLSKKNFIVLILSSKSTSTLKFLYIEGVILSYNFLEKKILIFFRNFFGVNSLNSVKLLQRPTFSNSLKFTQISKIASNLRLLAFSTDKGLMSSYECKKFKQGGKVLFTL
jgi:ribosomal protein S8